MDQTETMIAQGLDPSVEIVPVDLDSDGDADWHTLAEDPRVEIYGGPEERMVAVDEDADGDWEALAHDQNADGHPEVVMRDRDADGILEDVQTLPTRLAFGGGDVLGR